MMTPTNDQIFREAVRRREAVPIEQRLPVQDYVIEVVRENWTPPEPVDPDILAFREWGAADSEADGWTGGATLHRQGHFDLSEGAQAYLAGARMAAEREQERANPVVAFAVRVIAGVFNDLDHAKREARKAIDEYGGEA